MDHVSDWNAWNGYLSHHDHPFLGIAGPLLAAMDFVDSLAKVGTTVDQIDSILNGKEQHHGMTPVHVDSTEIRAEHVSFGYHHDKEILHDISLTIPEGTMTAFVGPSGSGNLP